MGGVHIEGEIGSMVVNREGDMAGDEMMLVGLPSFLKLLYQKFANF